MEAKEINKALLALNLAKESIHLIEVLNDSWTA